MTGSPRRAMGAAGQMTLDGLLPLVLLRLLLVLRPRIQRRKSLLQSGRYGKSHELGAVDEIAR
jgi:hypothetical protein